jgi:hypothetical protein
MEAEDFKDKMENLKKPHVEIDPPAEIKLAILNAKRSATLGIWLVILPYVFLACMVMKYELNLNFGFLDAFSNLVGKLDESPILWWIQPLILFVLPTAGIILNALAIMHVSIDRIAKSITVTIKLKWLNLVIIGVSAAIICFFLLYLIGENLHHPI